MPESFNRDASKFYIGAYAAAPSLDRWDAGAEGEFLRSVLELEGVAGLEVPFAGSLHKYDEPWIFKQLPSQVQFIVTTIPETMARLGADPDFGLASTTPSGRHAAVQMVGKVREAISRLNDSLGRQAVTALEIHSAPVASPGRSSGQALSESLLEISGWDWNATQLVLEHCDALVPGHRPAKGFLSLETEADVVAAVKETTGRPVTMAINWGRSAIEQRNPDAVAGHIELLRKRGILGGFIVSGAADVSTQYGPAWADVHVPPANALPYPDGKPDNASNEESPGSSSLLSSDRLKTCLAAAGTGPHSGFRAIKVAAPPGATTCQRVSAISATLNLARHLQPNGSFPADSRLP